MSGWIIFLTLIPQGLIYDLYFFIFNTWHAIMVIRLVHV